MTSDPVSVPAEERAMKALTLHQPWASLIAEGVKTIETRSWSTRHRGPIAIHAGRAKPVSIYEAGMVADNVGDGWRLVREHTTDSGSVGYRRTWLPLGAIVATATLADSVPMVPVNICTEGAHLTVYSSKLGLCQGSTVVGGVVDMTDQLPFGDFAPGRWAWLLTDVVKLAEPIPAKGKQGLWTWTP